MSSAAFAGVERSGLAPSPYAERREPRDTALDRFLVRHVADLRSRVRPGRYRLAREAAAVVAAGERLRGLDQDALQAETEAVRRLLVRGGFTRPGLVRAFALGREVAGRHLGMRHHPVQIMGGLVMARGGLAEMQTGEGKTLTAILPAVAAALAGRPVHVITANAYLSERDCAAMRPVYEALGLTVGHVDQDRPDEERRAAYAADVTYCTGHDVAFDYLRDRLRLGRRRAGDRLALDALSGRTVPALLLRGLAFAIVDEADSIMIDDARTPLILSAGAGGSAEIEVAYRTALDLARGLAETTDYVVAAERRRARLTKAGKARIEAATPAGLPGPLAVRRARDELVTQALCAIHLYRRDAHYIVQDGKVVIVDENTGRPMPDRSWERGLHQLIELKEGCATTEARRTIARITYQRFFRRYIRLSGMTGTARDAAGEFAAVYGLPVTRIPTHRPARRQDRGISLAPTAAAKWQAIAAAAARVSREEERPVLIGTRSVAASEALGRHLAAAGLVHRVLNARQDREEAEIVAAAGTPGCITVATNMAGRGTDILLAEASRAAGGLHVILSEFHDSVRIDRQLFGRCGRQGDPGSYEAIVSLEDEIFAGLGPLRTLAALPLGPLARWMPALLRRAAQGRTERADAAARTATMRQDTALEESLGFAGLAE